MDTKLLENYKARNSSPTIRQRAGKIDMDSIKKISSYRYRFSYQGSASEPYEIQVLQNNKTLVSFCSCPYDMGGLCKHEVAAIDCILTGEKPVQKTKVIKEINLGKTHEITPAILKGLKKTHSRQEIIDENFIAIKHYSLKKITTHYNFWPAANQIFSYNQKERTLKAECSCKTKGEEICVHLSVALEKIILVYGSTVFDPNYFQDTIRKFLSDYGISPEEDYQQFFDFLIDENGVKVKEKVQNIVPSLEKAKERFLPDIGTNMRDSFFVGSRKKVIKNTHGIGFGLKVFDYRDPAFPYFFPFKAKFKKRSREFVSSFREIDSLNLFDKFEGLSQKDRDNVLKILEFQQAQEKFFDNSRMEDLHDASLLFQEFLANCSDYPFFEADPDGNLTKKNLSPLQLQDSAPELTFQLTENKNFYTLKPLLKIEGKSYQLNTGKVDIFPLFCKHNQNIYPFKNPETFIYLNKFQRQGALNFQKKDYERLYEEIIAPLSENFEIETKVYKKSKKRAQESELQKQLYLSDYEGEYILLKPGVQYNEKLILLHSKEKRFDPKTQKILSRNEAFENNYLEELKAIHPDFETQEPPFFLTPEQLIEEEWLLKASEKMKQHGIAVFGANDLKSFKYSLHKPMVSMSVKSNIDWFDLDISVSYGKEKVSLKEIRKALLKKNKYVQLSDGTFGLLPKKWLDKFSKYFKAGEVKAGHIEVSNYQFNIIDDLHDELEETPQFLMALQEKKKRLQNLNTEMDMIKPPKTVKATLRPYQLQGLAWLVFLDDNKLGGCLADDMGLGKTLQTIAFLRYLKTKNKSKDTHLVIVPTSLMFNWENEIEKFCPSLKTLTYIGSDRQAKFSSFSEYDVVLSTYGSSLNDIEFLKEFSFGYVILDESQAIKNPNSKRYKAVRLLNSKNRLALTGTPIENNTFDLYAQMNFLNPGLLGSMNHFRKEFSEAIDKNKNEDASALLSQMIHPFLLRRTKEQVATELPDKTETVLYCEMKGEQRKVYETFKRKFRDYLMQKIDENGVAKSQFYVLEGLTKLRQICNSPELLNDEEDYGKASIKLDMLTEHIKSKTAEHKIVVFSQFTSMLALVKERLEEENLQYTYLDGKTKKREEKVTTFQEDENIRVFLISLKAGGVGLNLTAADYVFLIDPWWNPAVESQAIDRCYRIGQDKHVMAYRMIRKDTIEEKITTMQKNKKQVSSSIIQTDTAKKSFNTAQIKRMFS